MWENLESDLQDLFSDIRWEGGLGLSVRSLDRKRARARERTDAWHQKKKRDPEYRAKRAGYQRARYARLKGRT